jgi:Flp pilus assembly protein protease CpaA
MLLLPPIWMVIATIAFHTRGGRIPNLLVFPAFALAFIAAVVLSPIAALHASGSPLSVLASAVIAFAISMPFFMMGDGGAGAVKAHTTFAAWVGVVLPLHRAAVMSAIVSVLAWGCVMAAAWVDGRFGRDDREGMFPAQTWLCAGDLVVFGALLWMSGIR